MRLRPTIAVFAALSALTAVASAGLHTAALADDGADAIVSRTIRLRYATPSSLMPRLNAAPSADAAPGTAAPLPDNPPVGLVAIGVSDKAGTLTLRGPKSVVEDTEKAIRFLDVRPQRISVLVRLLRIPEDAEPAMTGKLSGNVVLVGKALLQGESTETLTQTFTEAATGDRWTAAVRSKINGDGSFVANVAVVREHAPQGAQSALETNSLSSTLPRTQGGRPARVVVFNSPSDSSTRGKYLIEVTSYKPNSGAGRLLTR